ncbi:hypothetical protein F750_5412 [Streptomyces sp. PAMC 26508]|nr:hypothetical protein F750_5412 [Streptomyces sp. PAMC 26508]
MTMPGKYSSRVTRIPRIGHRDRGSAPREKDSPSPQRDALR